MKSTKYAFVMLLVFYTAVGSYGQGEEFKTDSLLRALSPKQDSVRAWQLLRIAQHYLRTDSTQVKKYTAEALALAKKLHYGRGEIRAYALYGDLYYYHANFDRSEYWANLLLERSKIIKRVEDYRLMSLNSKAVIAYRRGNFLEAAQYVDITIREAEKALGKKGNEKYIFERVLYMGLNMKGNVYASNAFNRNGAFVNKQEYDKAYQCYRRCLSLCRKYPTLKNSIPTVCHNIACYYKDTHQSLDSALYYFNEEIHTATMLGQEIDLITAYYSKAEILFEINQFVAAEALLQKAQLLANKYQDPDHLIIIPHLLGRIYSKTGRHLQAIAILSKALTLVEEKKMTELKRAITEAIADSYHQQGDYKNALLYHKKASTLKDSLYNETTTKTINELSTKYETEKKEQQIKVLETEKKIKNYLILIALLALAVGVYVVRSRRKASLLEKQLLEQNAFAQEQEIEKKQIEIDAKNRELSLHSLYLEQRKNILQEVKKQLINKQPEMLDKNALLREIDATMQLETEWQNFKIHFEEIHPRFFEKLLEHSPNLTELELRHCAYIKLGFSPKQVAQILSIETDSVSIARVRLKKKLKLQEDETLQAFLKNC